MSTCVGSWQVFGFAAFVAIFFSSPDLSVRGAEPAAQKDERLKERDRYGEETVRLRREGKIKEAIAACNKMLAIEREVLGDLHEDVVGSLIQLAEMHEELGDFAAARKYREEILRINTKLHGEKDWRVTDARLDLEDLERRSRMTKGEQKELSEANELNRKVYELWRGGKSLEALPLAERAVETHGRVLGKDHREYALSVFNLGAQHDDLGHFDKAESLYKTASDIQKKALGEEHPDYAQSLNNVAVLYHKMGDYVRAEPHYRQALGVLKKVLGEEHPPYATSLNNLAGLYRAMGDYARAEPLMKQALEIRKKVLAEAHPDYATSFNNLGMLYKDMADYTRAEPLYKQALEISREVLGKEHPWYAFGLNNLAALYKDMGDFDRAEFHYKQALEILRKVLGEEHPDHAASLNNLSLLYHEMGDWGRAEPLYKQALEIRKKVLGEEHPDYATSVNNLAGLYYDMGEYARAEPLYKHALEIRKKVLGEEHPDHAASINNLSLLYHEMGEYARAEPLCRQALAIWKKMLGEEHPHYALSLHNLASLYRDMGDHARAAPLSKQALEIVRKNLDLASSIQSERQQLSMTRRFRSYLDGYLSLTRDLNMSRNEVYGQALSWKGNVFSRQSRLHRVRGEPELSPLFTELESIASCLAALVFSAPDPRKKEIWGRQIAELTKKKEELEKELSRRSPGFHRAKELSRLSPWDLQSILPEGAALVDFLEYTQLGRPTQGDGSKKDTEGLKGPIRKERHLLSFVVRRDGPIARVDLGPLRPIEEAIDAWREAIASDPGSGKEAEAATKLRRGLWEPIEKHLGSARVLLASPDGALGRFPLGVLPGSKPGSYLIEEYSLVLLPVPQLLPEVLSGKRTLDAAPSLLLVGDVDFDAEPVGSALAGMRRPEPGSPTQAVAVRGGIRAAPRGGRLLSFKPLDFTRGEILMVADTFQGAYRDATLLRLRGKDSTEAAFREAAPKCTFVHVATHGFFAPEELKSAMAPARGESAGGLSGDMGPGANVVGWHPGLLSGVVFAGANRKAEPDGDDGILTALEMASLDLSRTELLVLSACETGLGATAVGEGLLGLQRAAQVAGARAVVASLWKVDDQDAMVLMKHFYENLWKKGMGRLEALREAQLALLRGTMVRSLGAVTERPEGEPHRVSPRSWAAWVLSGDWR